jgi:outer membrane lipoprotein-sorting protein
MTDHRSSCARAAALALALFACSAVGVRAASDGVPDEVFAHPVDAKTRVAMTASFGRLSEKAVVSGAFVQSKRIKRLGRDLVSKGDFVFSAKDGVYWNISSPYPSTILMTATRLVQRSPDGESSVIDAKDNTVFKGIAGTMQAVFSGDLGALEGEFSVFFQGDSSSWRLGLIPKEKTVREIVASIVVEGDDSIRTLKLAEGSGDIVAYSFIIKKKADELGSDERGLFVF